MNKGDTRAANPERKAVRLLITGKVQGVWFRAWTEQEATKRGLNGWVRNRRDGSVEAVIAGPTDIVEEMVSHCHKGPPAARVAAVQVHQADQADVESGFVQRPTV